MKERQNKKWREDAKGKLYAICPKCHAQIYGLYETETHHILYYVMPTKGYETYYEVIKKIPDLRDRNKYKCPMCGKVIAKSIDEVKALFQEQE